ncbi:TetR/AcrR family transcriptional regulator [Catenuloplanes indicus]|uniref:AcrR family transcriptional regulator n=1 Tax=Catenuloplanes indicus TaxID=137267 RepID=A0AAE3VZQ6_9ACTN|nr:TetR/AcrR family transcriptional regulator [Catenuloplanes indicus]MDQ0366701.1 AcrR family transcriptional regulator [Catenuloplanes indicus]
MPAKNASKPLTLTEQARRAQLIGVAIDAVAAHGYAGTSLARIAEAAGISKAAVLYHFPSKDAVVQAAYATVLESLIAHVGAAVEPHTGGDAVEAYIRALVGYLRLHPGHTRMIIESLVAETAPPAGPNRHETVAALLTAAAEAGDYRRGIDPGLVAVIVNGAIDAIVSTGLSDPGFDTAQAADELIRMLSRTFR